MIRTLTQLLAACRKPSLSKRGVPTTLNDKMFAVYLISSLVHLRLHRIPGDDSHGDDLMRVNGKLKSVGATQR